MGSIKLAKALYGVATGYVVRFVSEKIKQIRESANVSQTVFAAILNTSLFTVQKWEIGQERPTGIALKLLHLAQTHGLDSLV